MQEMNSFNTHQIFTSNSYEKLFEHFALNYQKASPFDKQLVLIPSLATKMDLQRKLAQELGICMGVDFYFFEVGLLLLIQKLSPRFSYEKKLDLSLRIEKLLFKLLMDASFSKKYPELKPLIEYLKQDETQKRSLIVLADELASLFIQYALFNLDLQKWKEKPIQTWQQWIFREIWRSDSHLLNPMGLVEELQPTPIKPLTLHCFALSQYAPAHLQLLERIRPFVHLYVYFLSPTPLFWLDVKSTRENTRYHRFLSQKGVHRQELEQIELQQSTENSLLANWGVCGRRAFEQLESFPFNEWKEDFALNAACSKQSTYRDVLDADEYSLIHNNPTLLDYIKTDLMTLQQPDQKKSLHQDGSIEIFMAPTLRREVQHLKSQVFQLLRDSKASLNNIAIYVIELERYLPHIQAEFDEEKIPFSIMVHDHPLKLNNALIKGFFDVVTLDQKGWNVQVWVSLLQNPFFILSATCTEKEREKLIKWIERIGTTGCLDQVHLEHFFEGQYGKAASNPPLSSWESFFFEIMKLALTEQTDYLIDPVLKNLSLADLDLLNELYKQMSGLQQDLTVLKNAGHATFEEWSFYLKQILESYFIKDSIETKSFSLFLEDIAKSLEQEKEEKFSFETFWYYFEKDLSTFRPEIYQQKMDVLSFYSFFSKPFRSQDYTFILGLDEDRFPRNPLDSPMSSWSEFNVPILPSKVIEEDRYHFLQTLLCTEKKWTLSYTYKNQENGKTLNPSPVLEQLQAYCTQFYPFKEGNSLCAQKVFALPFDARYFKSEHSIQDSYDLAQSFYQTFKQKPVSFLEALFKSPSCFTLDAKVFEVQIDIHQFSHFFKNPLSFFLQKKYPLAAREDIWKNEQKKYLLSPFEKTLMKRSMLEKLPFIEQYPFQTEGMFKELTNKMMYAHKEKIEAYLKKEGLELEDFGLLELRSDLSKKMDYKTHHWLLPALRFERSFYRSLLFEGVIQQVGPKGLLVLSKPQFQTYWHFLPLILLLQKAFSDSGLLFDPTLHFPLHDKKVTFDLSYAASCLKWLIDYYQFGLQNPSMLMPAWIPYFMELSVEDIQMNIEKEVNSELFYPAEIKDLFYLSSALEAEHIVLWKLFTQTNLRAPYECILKSLGES